MRAAGHSLSPDTQQCYCGQELADLFLHVGSGWLLTEATDAREAVMNDLSLLLCSANRQGRLVETGQAEWRSSPAPCCIKQTLPEDSYSFSDFSDKLHALREQYYETEYNSKGWGWLLGNGRETTRLRVELLILKPPWVNAVTITLSVASLLGFPLPKINANKYKTVSSFPMLFSFTMICLSFLTVSENCWLTWVI